MTLIFFSFSLPLFFSKRCFQHKFKKTSNVSHKPPTWLQLRHSKDFNVPRDRNPFQGSISLAWKHETLQGPAVESDPSSYQFRSRSAASVDIFNPFWTGSSSLIVFVYPKWSLARSRNDLGGISRSRGRDTCFSSWWNIARVVNGNSRRKKAEENLKKEKIWH